MSNNNPNRNTPDLDLQYSLFHYLSLLAHEGECTDELIEVAKQIHAESSRLIDCGRGEDFLRSVAQQQAKDWDYVYAFESLLQWAFLRELRHYQLSKLLEPLGKVTKHLDDYQAPYLD